MKQPNSSLFTLCSVYVVLLLLHVGCARQPKTLIVPKGWYTPENQVLYESGIDEGVEMEGKKVATIRSVTEEIDSTGYGMLAQYCSAAPYLGKRIRLKGYLKTADVPNMACLWMRIDQADSMRMEYFDNMNDRGATGTSAWKPYDIVLDVPADAKALAFGALLCGSGQMWFGNLSIETVGKDVPTTGKHKGTYPIADYSKPHKDTTDYQHLNKAELEKEYKMARYDSKDCAPMDVSYVQELTNLGFDQ